MESASICKRPFSISGVLKRLGVSRSGFHAFLRHKPSAAQQRKDAVKDQIRATYDASKQIYGAPKITRELRKAGLTISERTVGKYMREMQRSYSHKGYPYNNACIESFHALIKREWLDRFKITDFRHAYRLVFEYIEAFYNTVRIHSHCDYMSPDQYEKLYQKVTAA